jgi:hypothetical protein
MRKFWAVFLVIFALAGTALAAAEIDLLTPGPGWTSAVRGGFQIVNAAALGISTQDYDLLSIKIRSTRSGLAELYWAPRRDQFSIYRNYPFYVADRYETNLINLAAYNRDGSVINHFLLVSEGTLEISELKLIKSNPWQKVLAGWQEFFGPLSRTQDGMEYLVIRSPRLFGSSFMYLSNAFLLVLLLAVLLLRGKKDLRRAFLLILLTCWGLAELNSLRNNFLAVQRDVPYLGKTLETKRAIMNEGDFYAFIKFAGRELPPAASFEIATARPYYDYRAAYYLYPRDYLKGADYLLVYDGRLERRALKKYKLWKTFRPGAYIYKS